MKSLALGVATAGLLMSGVSFAQTSSGTTPPGSTPPLATSPLTSGGTPTAPAGTLGSGSLGSGSTGAGSTAAGPSGSVGNGSLGNTATGAVRDRTHSVPAASGNNNQAVATTDANAPTPAKGSNSFTMSEAKTRLEKSGFQNVGGLTKDDNGVWRGQAQKDGTTTMVWLDYKGNVGQGK